MTKLEFRSPKEIRSPKVETARVPETNRLVPLRPRRRCGRRRRSWLLIEMRPERVEERRVSRRAPLRLRDAINLPGRHPRITHLRDQAVARQVGLLLRLRIHL